jgi:hypothetical protein
MSASSHLPAVTPRRLLRAAALVFFFALALPAFASAQTVVSLEFDDGTADQQTAATILQAQGMTGTYFINSGRLGATGYFTLAQVQALAAAGNEIGGHTVTHADLPTLSTDEAARQICNDRVALLGDGFAVTDLAYPYGDTDAAVEQIAASCGYNSARTIGGILAAGSCNGCALAESIPPADPYDTQTPGSVQATETLAQMETQVEQSPAGGWVQLVMHHICAQDGGVNCDPTYSIDPATLTAFTAWLKTQVTSGAVVVKTVHQVMGGVVKPGVPGPTASSPATGNLLQDGNLENVVTNPNFNNGLPIPSCFQLGQSGTNNGTGAVTTDAHSPVSAEKVSISSFSSGDERLLSLEDLGGCAPAVQAGHSYVFSDFYHSTVPLTMEAYLRSSTGGWGYWADNGAATPAAATYTAGSFTTPPVPASGVFDASDNLSCPCTGIAVAVSLRKVGSFTADDLSLTDADTTAPSVTLTAPADGAVVSGNVTLSANASDASGIRQVAFLVNGQPIGTSTTPPYQVTWNSAGSTTATIAARATDTAGNITTSPAATVTVTQPDVTAPSSKASSPAGTTTSPWTVSYTAADNAGGSGLASLQLWAKAPGATAYTEAASTTTPAATGSFSYTALAGAGNYSFYTLAVDKAGNVQAAPATPDATTSFTPVVPDTTAPTSTASSPSSVSTSPWTVSYTAADNTGGSGVASVALWAKAPGASTYTQVSSLSSASPTGTFTYTAGAGAGNYSFYTLATDAAGNAQAAPATPDATTSYTPVVPDITPPSSQAASPAATASTPWTVTYTAADNPGGSGVASVALWVKAPGSTSYVQAAANPGANPAGTFTYAAAAGAGAYSFYTLATDAAGNTQAVPGTPDAVTIYTPVVADTTPPSSAASSPATATTAGWTVSYTAADNAGGSGLGEVDLYAQAPGASAFTKVAADTSGAAAGTFSYTASAGNGAYRFYTLATDKAGNAETAPASPEATTTLTLPVPDTTAPSSKASSPATATAAGWTVSYTAADNTGGSGLAEVDLYAQAPGASTFSKVASDTTPGATGSFAYTAAAGNGAYSFYTLATDKAGNVEAAPSTADATTTLTVPVPDTTPPSSSASSPANATTTNWSVTYTAADNPGGSGLASVELWAKAPGASAYAKVASAASTSATGSFTYAATAGNGSYSFYTVAVDQAGNRQVPPTSANTTTILSSQGLSAASISTANLVGGTKGKFEKGDSITFVYSAPVKPSTVLAGWTGPAQAVHINVDGSSASNSVLTVWTMNGVTQLPLGSVNLGGIYNQSAEFQFNATMVQSSTSITLTLGAKHSGQQMTTAVKGGTVTWTPNAAVTDAAGNKASTNAVSTPGPAF